MDLSDTSSFLIRVRSSLDNAAISLGVSFIFYDDLCLEFYV